MTSLPLTCNNKTVIKFYNEHPNIDFETMNVTFVEILNSLSQDITSSLSNNIDELMEVYIGKYERQPLEFFDISMKATSNSNGLLEYLKENREMIRNIIRNKHFKNCSEIQNILDNILLSISKTIYLCKLE